METKKENPIQVIKSEKRSHKRIGSFQNPLKVRLKKLTENAIIPTYAHSTDAGMDLYATSKTFGECGNLVIGTGIAVEIPQGYVGLVFPRSSIYKHYCYLTNAVGVIDSGYRGEIMFKFAPQVSHIEPDTLWQRLLTIFKGYTWWSMDYSRRRKKTISRTNEWGQAYNIGDRVGQLIIIPYPKVQLIETDELVPDAGGRGTGGYGSTGE